MLGRIALLIALTATPRPAAACVRAGEANQLVGWSADGRYALYELVSHGTIEHAEILPTSYSGYVYTITAADDQILVARVPVGTTPSFGDDVKTIVEHKPGRLTEKTLMALATVAAFRFGPAEPAKDPKISAAFTGKQRYDAHDASSGEHPVMSSRQVIAVRMQSPSATTAPRQATARTSSYALAESDIHHAYRKLGGLAAQRQGYRLIPRTKPSGVGMHTESHAAATSS
jgi:hypothetical protein